MYNEPFVRQILPKAGFIFQNGQCNLIVYGTDRRCGSIFFILIKKHFCYYSQVHKTFSRINYFYVDNYFLPAVDSKRYENNSGVRPCSTGIWPFVCTFTKDMPSMEVELYIAKHWWLFPNNLQFHITNKSNLISPSLLWETLKVVVRGVVISNCVRLNTVKWKK